MRSIFHLQNSSHCQRRRRKACARRSQLDDGGNDGRVGKVYHQMRPALTLSIGYIADLERPLKNKEEEMRELRLTNERLVAYFQKLSGNARTPDTGVENEDGVDEAGKAEKASKPKVKGVGKASKKITNPDLDDTSLELEATKAIKKGEQREKNKKTGERRTIYSKSEPIRFISSKSLVNLQGQDVRTLISCAGDILALLRICGDNARVIGAIALPMRSFTNRVSEGKEIRDGKKEPLLSRRCLLSGIAKILKRPITEFEISGGPQEGKCCRVRDPVKDDAAWTAGYCTMVMVYRQRLERICMKWQV